MRANTGKATLPDGEIEEGLTPGRDYPVFQTRFGTLGMMICYDGFFPEVARELTKRGAEVIAWPVWGCNPELARARAAENHTYLVNNYEDISRNWMLSAVWDHTADDRARQRLGQHRDRRSRSECPDALAQPWRLPVEDSASRAHGRVRAQLRIAAPRSTKHATDLSGTVIRSR